MELAIQKLTILSLLVIGVSHIVQHRAWAQFFIELRAKGDTGSLINAFIHFPLGALIVAFHNVWQGLPTLVTLLGYAWVIKSTIYFVSPSRGLESMERVSLERSKEFVVAGVFMVVIAGVLGVGLFGGL